MAIYFMAADLIGSMKTIEGKVVVLGSQGVGKTSMVVRYIGKMFSHHISPTIGASFFTCKIIFGETRVKLQIWDTAGQERFRSMAPMYYRNANAALLVFDITQYHTFTSVKHWVKELRRNVEDPILVCLIGNKTDLASQRKVAREEALEYAGTIGGLYYETSALQDQGIEDIFVTAAEELVKLSEDPNCSTIRVVDSSDNAPHPLLRELSNSSGVQTQTKLDGVAVGQPTNSVCC